MRMPSDIRRQKPPWHLKGTAFVLFFRFASSFVKDQGFLLPTLQENFQGGIGAVMLIDYSSSEIGPYRELLFLPGRFCFASKLFYTITKIYVSTWDRVVNGKLNWNIPKEIATFEVSKEGSVEQVRVSHKENEIANFTFKASVVSIPVTTAFIPSSWRTLAQVEEDTGKVHLVTPRARGFLKRASLLKANVNRKYFPDITNYQPLAVLKLERFNMVFPEARLLVNSN